MITKIKIYSVMDRRDMSDRREELRNLKKNNYQGMSNGKKIARQVELNFLEMLLEAQSKGNYI